MFSEPEIADLYRQIGLIMRKHGAFGVYILSSKITDGSRLDVEVIADRTDDYETALKEICSISSDMTCILYDGEDPSNYRLLMEAREEGIRL